MVKKNVILLLFFYAFLGVSASSRAVEAYQIYKMSDLELSMLPIFCRTWHAGDWVTTDVWVKKLQISNIHHFCKGLNHVNHAIISSSQSHATAGISEFEYILKKYTKKSHFPLKAFIFLNMAKLYGVRNDKKNAIASYKVAIEENPKFIKAYLELIDLLIQYKDKESAREVVEQGLINNPNSKLLLKRKKNLKF